MSLHPTTPLVAAGWCQLAVSGVAAGTELPDQEDAASYAALRADGFMRITGVGGDPGMYVPMRNPVVQVECWLAPPQGKRQASWARAEQIAARLVAATYDPALMGVLVDLSEVGDYANAWVHTVIALTEPDRVEEDESDFARVDVDLELRWTSTTTTQTGA